MGMILRGDIYRAYNGVARVTRVTGIVRDTRDKTFLQQVFEMQTRTFMVLRHG